MAINVSTVIRPNRPMRSATFVRRRGMEGGLNAQESSVASGFINIAINIFRSKISFLITMKNYIFVLFVEKTKNEKYYSSAYKYCRSLMNTNTLLDLITKTF